MANGNDDPPFDAHWEGDIRMDHQSIPARSLVDRSDALHLPIGPVESVLKHGDAERMRNLSLIHLKGSSL